MLAGRPAPQLCPAEGAGDTSVQNQRHLLTLVHVVSGEVQPLGEERGTELANPVITRLSWR